MAAERSVLMRADAGLGIGYGHVSRCLALAHEFTARGAEVTIALRSADAALRAKAAAAGATVVDLGQAPAAEVAGGAVWSAESQAADVAAVRAAAGDAFHAVVVDHYRLDAQWERPWRASGARVVVIDDLANRTHAADVLVDQNWYGPHTHARYEALVEPQTQLLLGPRYAVLHPDYRAARAERAPVAVPPQHVLVAFGATDVTGQSLLAVEALAAWPQVRVDVVVGTEQAVTPQLEAAVELHPNATLHVALPTLVPLLAQADLALGAGGTGTWERLCLRVPTLVTTVSENQAGVTRAFAEAGIVRWLGNADAVDATTYRDALATAMAGDVPAMPDIVDGYGAARVALAAMGAELPALSVRDVHDADVAAVTTAGGAGIVDDAGPQLWNERAQRFLDRHRLREHLTLIESDGVPVGVVTHSAEPRIEVDPFVDPAQAVLA